MSRKRLSLCFAVSLLLGPATLLAQRINPLQTFMFGLDIKGSPTAYFKSVSGLSSESEVIEYRSGGETQPITQKIPGKLKYSDITLKRGITGDKSFAIWRKLVEDGHIDQARKDGSIALYDASGQEIARWKLTSIWPDKYAVETDEESGQLLEVISLAVEVMQRQ